MQLDPQLKNIIAKDEILQAFSQRYSHVLQSLTVDCVTVPACYTKNMLWDSVSILRVADRLGSIYRSDATFRRIMHRHLAESGVFLKWFELPDEEILKSAWTQEISAVNHILTTYTTNKGFRYPEIDSNNFDVNAGGFKEKMRALFSQYHTGSASRDIFFYPSMRLALDLLKMAHRDEAGRYEPIDNANRQALKGLAKVDWRKYPYSAILVFGAGPDGKENISETGKTKDAHMVIRGPIQKGAGALHHSFGWSRTSFSNKMVRSDRNA